MKKKFLHIFFIHNHTPANPFPILLFHVEVIGGVDPLFHSPPVSGDPALNSHISWSRMHGKLFQILQRHRRGLDKTEQTRIYDTPKKHIQYKKRVAVWIYTLKSLWSLLQCDYVSSKLNVWQLMDGVCSFSFLKQPCKIHHDHPPGRQYQD